MSTRRLFVECGNSGCDNGGVKGCQRVPMPTHSTTDPTTESPAKAAGRNGRSDTHTVSDTHTTRSPTLSPHSGGDTVQPTHSCSPLFTRCTPHTPTAAAPAPHTPAWPRHQNATKPGCGRAAGGSGANAAFWCGVAGSCGRPLHALHIGRVEPVAAAHRRRRDAAKDAVSQRQWLKAEDNSAQKQDFLGVDGLRGDETKVFGAAGGFCG